MIQFAKGLLAHGHLAICRLFGIDETIVLRIIQTDAGRIFAGEGLGHLAADVDADGRITTRTGVVEVAAQPTVFFIFVRIAGGLPNLGRAKMRAVGIRIANALDDPKLAGIKQTLEASQSRMQTEAIVQFQNIFC